MNMRKYIDIFYDIESPDYTVNEKALAILMVMKMPTHNGITKEKMLEVIKWLWNQHFELEGDKK